MEGSPGRARRRAARNLVAVLGLALGLVGATATAQQLERQRILRDAGDATYRGIYDQPITLMAGHWEGEPYLPGDFARPAITLLVPLLRLGDVTGDGNEDVVVGLEESGGGTGHFLYLAVLERRDGRLVNVATRWIEDRVPVRSLQIVDGRIVLRSLQEGPGDAACCKTLKVRQVFEVQGGELVELSREELGQVSVADLEGTRWVLEALGDGATALPAPAVTLSVADGRVTGTAGCNRYQASLANPERTDLEVGALMTTRKRCEPLVMAQEDGYVARLSSVVSFSFDAGRLALVYGTDAGARSLTFRDDGPAAASVP